MAQPYVRLKNISGGFQQVQIDGNWITVNPGGFIRVAPGSPVARLYAFEDVTNAQPVLTKTEASLKDKVAQLEAQLAAAQAEAEAAKAANVQDNDGEEDNPVDGFPRHLAGGRFELSDGTVTKGGTSRADAIEMEAALHSQE